MKSIPALLVQLLVSGSLMAQNSAAPFLPQPILQGGQVIGASF